MSVCYDRAMDPTPDTLPLLDEAAATFIRQRTSISVAARDADNLPDIARASGCLASADRRRLTVFLCPDQAAHVLDCLRDNGAIAVAVTRPSTHQTLQFKGRVVEIAPMSAADRAALAAYLESFVDEIGLLGYRAEFARAVVPHADDCLAVTFEPTALFDQTPGPKAGEALGVRP